MEPDIPADPGHKQAVRARDLSVIAPFVSAVRKGHGTGRRGDGRWLGDTRSETYPASSDAAPSDPWTGPAAQRGGWPSPDLYH